MAIFSIILLNLAIILTFYVFVVIIKGLKMIARIPGKRASEAKDLATFEFVQSQISADEHLICSDRQKTSAGFGIFIILLGVMSASVFIMMLFTMTVEPSDYAIIAFMFLLLFVGGLGMAYLGVYSSFLCKSKCFFVTDKRLCIKNVGFNGKPKIESIPRETIQGVTLIYSKMYGVSVASRINIRRQGKKLSVIVPINNASLMANAIHTISLPYQVK